MTKRFLFTVAAAAWLATGTIAHARPSDPLRAAPASQQPQQRPETITRVYPISGLLGGGNVDVGGTIVLTPNIEMTHQGGGGGSAAVVGGQATVTLAAPDQKSAMQSVAYVITETIATETWADNGGDVGRMVFFQDKLIITHTPAVHQEVAGLLESLQGDQVVTVQAVLVEVAEAQLSDASETVDGVTVWKGEPTNLETLARVRVSGFAGRPHAASDGRRVGYIADVNPIVAADAVGYEVRGGEQREGLTLHAVPRVAEDGRSVTVEVEATYALIAFGGPQSPTTRPSDDGTVVLPDLLTVDEKRIATTLRLPAGRWVLVGSLQSSRDGRPSADAPLHLLLRIDGADGRAAQ